MNTTIHPAVFQDIGAQILKKPPSDTETFKHLWETILVRPPLFVVFSWIDWLRHDNRCQTTINTSISSGDS